jgi:hypothetical protein
MQIKEGVAMFSRDLFDAYRIKYEQFNDDLERFNRSIKITGVIVGKQEKNVLISLAESSRKIEAACDLINDRYNWRGYGSSHCLPRGNNTITFTAEIDNEVVGTITLGVDSNIGMSIDKTFSDDVNDIRSRSNAKVCELKKFAFDPRVQSKEVMAALFHVVFIYGQRTYGCTDLVIEVNPRHVRFYESMLGFRKIGGLRTNEAVDAPAQLMWLPVSDIRKQIDCMAGSESNSSRSLYPYFLLPVHENRLYSQLTSKKVARKRKMEVFPPECRPLMSNSHRVAVSRQMGRIALAGGGR